MIAVWQPSKKDERGYPGWVPLVQLQNAQPIRESGVGKSTALAYGCAVMGTRDLNNINSLSCFQCLLGWLFLFGESRLWVD